MCRIFLVLAIITLVTSSGAQSSHEVGTLLMNTATATSVCGGTTPADNCGRFPVQRFYFVRVNDVVYTLMIGRGNIAWENDPLKNNQMHSRVAIHIDPNTNSAIVPYRNSVGQVATARYAIAQVEAYEGSRFEPSTRYPIKQYHPPSTF